MNLHTIWNSPIITAKKSKQLPKKTLKCVGFHVCDKNVSFLCQRSIQHCIKHRATTAQYILVCHDHLPGLPHPEGDITVYLVVKHIPVALRQGFTKLPLPVHAFIWAIILREKIHSITYCTFWCYHDISMSFYMHWLTA